MAKRLKKTLIVLLLALCALFVFAGCELGVTKEDALNLRGVNAQVTYYANGGRFEKNNQKKKTDFYFQAGATAYDYGAPGVILLSGKAEIDRANFEFMGWYFVDEVTDEENGICTLGKKVDFSVPLQEGDHWLVAAKWKALVGLQVVLVTDNGASLNVELNDKDKTPTTYANGATIGEVEYDYTTDQVVSAPKEFFKVTGKTHTFYTYYNDSACTERTQFPITRGEEAQTIYAKYIQGDWTVVSKTSDVRSMFSTLQSGSNKRYIFLNDVDCSKLLEVTAIRTMNGEINGNGYALKNLKVIGELSGKNNDFALFGSIGATAKITNLTIENVSMTAKFSTPDFHANVYFLFTEKDAGATISNVNVSGTLKVNGPRSCVVDNIMLEGGNVFTHCLYGGYTADEAYVTASQGKEFVVSGNAETIVTIELQ